MTPDQEHELTLLMAASQRGDCEAYETLLQGLWHAGPVVVTGVVVTLVATLATRGFDGLRSWT